MSMTNEEVLKKVYFERVNDLLVQDLAARFENALTEIETLKGEQNES